MTFASIDIGSNAVRLLFASVFDDPGGPIFRKISLIRVPIRLGDDAFLTGRITDGKADDLVSSMHAFRHLISVHRPIDYVACATSAIRTAENGLDIVERIREETGIAIEVIDGQREAEIIYSNHVAETLDAESAYLYIEVGGGSTELTLFDHGIREYSKSFRIGSVRILHNMVDRAMWAGMKEFILTHLQPRGALFAIGTGGNINTMFKLLGAREGKPINVRAVKKEYRRIKAYTVDERVRLLGMRPDRADVIIPAMDIYLSVLKWAGIRTIYVPKIGLADGLIHLLYERYRIGQEVTGAPVVPPVTASQLDFW